MSKKQHSQKCPLKLFVSPRIKFIRRIFTGHRYAIVYQE